MVSWIGMSMRSGAGNHLALDRAVIEAPGAIVAGILARYIRLEEQSMTKRRTVVRQSSGVRPPSQPLLFICCLAQDRMMGALMRRRRVRLMRPQALHYCDRDRESDHCGTE